MTEEQEAELQYLQWFYVNADFGPAHEDVITCLNQDYVDETGSPIPAGYESF
jgi:hypothetical protein